MAKNPVVQGLLSKNLVSIGLQWYRNTFSKERAVQKSVEEDSQFIAMSPEYYDDISPPPEDDERFHDQYSPICNTDEIFVEYENLQAYSYFLILALKWRHAGGMTSDRGLCFQDVYTLLRVNITKKKR